MKNKNLWFVFFTLVLSLTGMNVNAEEFKNPLMQENTKICYLGKCQNALDMMGQNFLQMSLTSLLKDNVARNLSLCEADSESK